MPAKCLPDRLAISLPASAQTAPRLAARNRYTMKPAKRIAVIGAGASGLGCIKCCLDEGLEPVCFERTEDIGGLWNFKENVPDDRGTVYKSLISNSSKEMMCYSDFPYPDHFPPFMHNTKVLQYYRLYAKNFKLFDYIQLKTEVRNVSQRLDFSTTGQWDVTVTDSDGNMKTSIFDGVLVCTGHHCNPHLPLDSFPGIEKFKGQYMHSKMYREPNMFAGKRVVVIGIGNTAGDLAVDISRYAKQVFLSTRGGTWVFSRIGNSGYPVDMLLHNRYASMMAQIFPFPMVASYYESGLNSQFKHDNYGLQPNHRVMSRLPMISDELPSRIISGTVVVKSNVRRFTETEAVFEDGTREEVDWVVFSTGYSVSYPFLAEGLAQVAPDHVALYRHVFPPSLEPPTLAVIGLVDPLVAINPIAEMQSRWATRIFAGRAKLPPVHEMMNEITEREKKTLGRSDGSQRRTLQVEYIPYMDWLAEQIGARPDIKRLFLTDPRLAFQVFFGPCSPYQFRLAGPGKWDGAKAAILSQWDRAINPTRTRMLDGDSELISLTLLLKVLAALAIVCAFVLLM